MFFPKFLGRLGGAVGEGFCGEAFQVEKRAEDVDIRRAGWKDEFAQGGDFCEGTEVGDAGAVAAEGFEGHGCDGREVGDVGV